MRLWESVWIDARYAVRALGRSRAFAATAVLTLGVGLALASVAFTLFNAYVLRPFAVADPDSLYRVRWTGKDRWVGFHSWRDYEELRARRDIFSGALASRDVTAMGIERYWLGKAVSGNYFRMLGARVELGRTIEERDAQTPLGDHVIVISHEAWKSAFQLDPDVLGKKVVLRGRPYDVIGVAAREFAGLEEAPPDFWAPMSMHAAFRAEELVVEVVGRLRPGVTQAQAEGALGAMANRDSGQERMRAELASRATVLPLTPTMLAVISPVVLALALVLATCCANVANMLLARGVTRQREIGVRLSLGAARARLVRQLLTEALVISILAGLAGLAIARLTLDGAVALLFATAEPELVKSMRLHSLDLDYRVFVFAFAVAALAAIGAALAPALQATRPNMVAALRGEFGANFRASRLRDGLVVFQVVVCAVLLVCGALVYRRAAVFQAVETGMRQEGVIDIAAGDRGAAIAAELATRPDVETVAMAQRAPWFGRLNRTRVSVSGSASSRVAGYNIVTPEYFRVLDIAFKSGRPFTEIEARTEAAVAIVSQSTARAFWPGEDPIGKTIRAVETKQRHVDNLPVRGEVHIVGVVEDVVDGWMFDRDRSAIYLPASKTNVQRAGEVLVLVRGAENTVLHRFRQRLADHWPDFDGQMLPLSEVLRLQIYPFRAAASIGWALGVIAMALSVSGMYGVMSFLVNQRAKEIGIRIALGATPLSVVGTVMRRSAWLACTGALIGAGVAAGAVQLLLAASAELGVLAWDSVALAAGAGIAGVAAMAAALGPSSRAARVDPNAVLRAD